MKYPHYAKGAHSSTLYAFISKSEMYKIEPIGSNVGNDGITIDHYITRKMVLKHERNAEMGITKELFIHLAGNLFTAIINKITA